ncbi:Type II secretion system protein C [Pseudomonas syringae pv. actinidiae]|uniref:Type II secretion system protein C n=1 Tax=Pseudomonas syringae pv. actinidiae TaxID=103796 RepID=A0A3M4KS87_PSESF|nr:Type II secretion system protein C [Pseudomonas syringae pv. actinidiae]
MRAGRALGQFPVEGKEIFQVLVAPLGRRRGPGHFQAAGDGVATFTGAKFVAPAKALLLKTGCFRLRTNVVGRASTVSLAESVTTGDQRHGLFVIHGHAAEGFADIPRRSDRVRHAFRAFRVHVDQAHLHGGQRVFQITFATGGAAFFVSVVLRLGHQGAVARLLHFLLRAVTLFAAQPGGFGTPIHVFFRFPDIRATTGKTEGLEAHGFQRHVTGEHDQVGPGNLAAVLLLDRPDQATCLVQADVVRPAVERRKPLLTGTGTATAITGAVSTGAVPGHTNEQRAVVAKIRRPPVLRPGHDVAQVLLDRFEVQTLELFGIVKALAHRVGERRMLVQNLQIQLLGPPVTVGGAAAGSVVEGAFRFS